MQRKERQDQGKVRRGEKGRKKDRRGNMGRNTEERKARENIIGKIKGESREKGTGK
jgi:hypothetical protein